MRVISSLLFLTGALIFVVGALLAGSPGLAVGALAVSGLFIVSIYLAWRSLVLDLCLVVVSGFCTATVLVGIAPGFAIATIPFVLLGWNGARQFAGIDNATSSEDALRRHVMHYLGYTLPPAALVGVLIAGAFFVHVPLQFGIALLLALAALMLVCLSLIIASRRRAKRLGLSEEDRKAQLRAGARYR